MRQDTRPTESSGTKAAVREARRMQLYGYGLSDADIGKRMGVTNSAIRHWRKDRGLPRNREPSRPMALSDKAQKERISLWKRGLTDVDMANRLHVTPRAIINWRHRNKLKVNPTSTRIRRDLVPIMEQRLRLYRLGRTDRQIAEAQGISLSAVSTWRSRRGLDPNDGTVNPDGPVRLVSMDAELGEGGFNRHAFTADDAAAIWLEEMGATKW